MAAAESDGGGQAREACFLCADDAAPVYRVCKCNQHVHAACFRDLVARVPGYAQGCMVCRQPYTFVSRPTGTWVCASDVSADHALDCLRAATAFICGVLLWAFVLVARRSDSPCIADCLPLAGALGMGAGTFALLTAIYYRNTGRVCFLTRVYAREVVVRDAHDAPLAVAQRV